ncbi:MAG: glycosyltransferase [Anaerolineales bacterium]|nr:glycosyltransferase [Anaerolineales bacterium]
MPSEKIRVSVITSCFNGEAYLSSFIDQLTSQTIFPALEWILIHNEPTPREMDIIKEFQARFPEKIKHIVTRPVEPLSASWNRGWKAACADHASFWNLDDCRPDDALQRQVETLEQNPDCMMTYGDFIEVSQYGSTIGLHRSVPSNYANRFRRTFPGGAFMVWRRNGAEKIGYFDEQLHIACDYDLVTRAAVEGLKMKKTEGVIGYFTNQGTGLSTLKGANKEAVERTVVQLRYGMFDKAASEHISDAEKYRIAEIFVGGHWLPLTAYIEQYTRYIKQRMILKKFNGMRKSLLNIFGGAR